jgi:hypothetical protein
MQEKINEIMSMHAPYAFLEEAPYMGSPLRESCSYLVGLSACTQSIWTQGYDECWH